MGRSLWETYYRARKTHACDICGLLILPQEVYLRWVWVEGRDRGGVKAHPVCERQVLAAIPPGEYEYECDGGVDCVNFTAADVRADAVFGTPDEAAQIERVASAIEQYESEWKRRRT